MDALCIYDDDKIPEKLADRRLWYLRKVCDMLHAYKMAEEATIAYALFEDPATKTQTKFKFTNRLCHFKMNLIKDRMNGSNKKKLMSKD